MTTFAADVTTSEFLDAGEVEQLTGYVQPARQWDRISQLGLVPLGRGRGHPVTCARAALESLLDNHPSRRQNVCQTFTPDLTFSGLNRRKRTDGTPP